MNVYVLIVSVDYSHDQVLGVFSNPKLAMNSPLIDIGKVPAVERIWEEGANGIFEFEDDRLMAPQLYTIRPFVVIA